VPPRLREWAFLDREIVFAGVGKRIELWDRGRHRAELEGTRASYGEFANLLREFGL
jgi:DNA-binding transcriptional regulator/RsmH inhibitor MraZ